MRSGPRTERPADQVQFAGARKATKLPPEIEVQRLIGDDVRYMLPKRPAGRGSGRGLIAFGIVMFGFMIFWAHGFGAGGLLLGLPGFAGSLAVTGLGLAVLGGRAVIELRDGILRCSERVGLFSWTRRRPIANVCRLFVATGDSGNRSPGSSFGLFILRAELGAWQTLLGDLWISPRVASGAWSAISGRLRQRRGCGVEQRRGSD